MRFRLLFTLLLSTLLSSFTLISQNLPKVFLIGENEQAYETMIGDYPDLLLTVCDNSMDKAYEHWIDMLVSMEDFADSIDYDIKGVKIWMNLFWNNEGVIDHIVYYPKPNSRNIDFDEFSNFLTQFVDSYQMPLTFQKGYSHYGSASFPSFGKRMGDKG